MKYRIFTALILACLACSSCITQKLELTYNAQEEKIDKYIESALNKNKEYTVARNKGSNRLIKTPGKGEALSEHGMVAFYYAGYTFAGSLNNSSVPFVTNHEETALGLRPQWILTDQDFSVLELDMSDTELLEGLRNGLIGVQGGEVCEILFSGKYAFGDHSFGVIPRNSALAFKIWVISVSND